MKNFKLVSLAKNGSKYKAKNRNMVISKGNDDLIRIRFRRLFKDSEDRDYHMNKPNTPLRKVLRGKVLETKLIVQPDCIVPMMHGLLNLVNNYPETYDPLKAVEVMSQVLTRGKTLSV